MLVLSRKVSQRIRIGSDICITVVKVDRNQVRLGITAPDGVTILREELFDPTRGQRSDSDLDTNYRDSKPMAAHWSFCAAAALR